MPVTTLNSNLSQPGLVISYAGYLYVSLLGDGIRQLDLSGNVVNATWFKSPNPYYYTAITVSGNYMYLAWGPNWNQQLAQIKMDNSGNFISVNENFYTNTSGIVDVKGYDANNLFILVNNSSFYLIKIDNAGAFISASLIFNTPVSVFTIYNSNIYVLGDNFRNYDFSGNLISTFGLKSTNTVRSITIYQNYIYVGYQSSGTDGIIQYNMDGLATDDNVAGQNINGSPFGLCTSGSKLYITTQQSNKLYSADLPANGTIIPPIIKWSKIDICYNTTLNTAPVGGLVFQGYYSYDSTRSVRSFYSADDITKNIFIDSSNAFLSSLKQRANFTICNKVTGTGALDSSQGGCYVKCLPFMKNIFVSEPYIQLQGTTIVVFDNFGKISNTRATQMANTLWGTETNGNKYVFTEQNFASGGWSSYYTPCNAPTINLAPLPVDHSFFGTVKYLDFHLKNNNNTVVKAYFVFKLNPGQSRLCAVYLYTSTFNILLGRDVACDSYLTNPSFGQQAGLTITNIPALDSQYSSVGSYNMYGFATNIMLGPQTAFDLSLNPTSNTYFQGRLISLQNGTLIATNTILDTQPPPPPPPIQYARMRINYNSVVNSNPVGGTVFDGYYSYQTTDNKVVSLYSSSDLTTNLIIPSTDPFINGALTLLGKTSSNTANSSGIDTTASHAGLFVKDLPFVNALFKSNPYVVLKPSGMVMFDNYGAVNANVLATSYFANKYVMSNGNVYSNKNNSFFSFSNFTFTYNAVSAIPTVNVPQAIDYTFFNSIKQIAYTAKYNGDVVKDSVYVFYLDSLNNYHMCAQYVKTANHNILVSSDESCDNFPNTGNFGNTAIDDENQSSNTVTATSGDAETPTLSVSEVNETGTPAVIETFAAVGAARTVNLNALNSNICFSEGSIVSTDQGDVEIQNIDIHYHTIRNNKIIALTETQSIDNYLVKIKKNAFGSVPTQDTEMTGNHMIFNNGFIQAKTLINGNTIEKIPYRGLPLYNILLEQHNIMNVNGLITETLNPENPIAKYYVMMEKNPENKVEMENIWRKRTQEIIHASF